MFHTFPVLLVLALVPVLGTLPELPITQPLEANQTKAGTVLKFEIADKLFMEFCFIPSGEAKLGSLKDEQRAVFKTLSQYPRNIDKEPGWLIKEAKEERGTFKTKGFWLGKYEVTQAEWKAMMGDNPSLFISSHFSLKGKNTDRFPVESVSWNECQILLKRMNQLPNVAKFFGKEARFVLPHENEWEYAYRGGKGNDRPFYWGNELNGTQANCDGTFPFGTDKKGQLLKRTCPVDDTNDGKYEVHPWGLHHMSGNVEEWCENKDSDGHYAQCGGSWADRAWNCRASSRYAGKNIPVDFAKVGFGLRVCVRLE